MNPDHPDIEKTSTLVCWVGRCVVVLHRRGGLSWLTVRYVRRGAPGSPEAPHIFHERA
jgi:hypothetical protein